MKNDHPPSERAADFLKEVGSPRKGVISQWKDFLRETRKYWLVPILIVFLLLAVLVVVGGSAAAPFLYPLF
jgi:hypothetical protein